MGLRWHNLVWLGPFWVCAAWPNGFYAHTGNKGRIHPGNVPGASSYMMRVEASLEAAGAKAAKIRSAFPLPGYLVYDQLVREAALANGLESALLHAVITVESKYDPKALSNKGAIGLMQLTPQIARQYGIANIYDPAQNIQGGARYLRDLLNIFKGDISLALAAYNAGEGAVAKFGNRIPPYRETSKYVPRVLNFYQKYRANTLY